MPRIDLQALWSFGDDLIKTIQRAPGVPSDRVDWIAESWKEDEYDGLGDMLCAASEYDVQLPSSTLVTIRDQIIPSAENQEDADRIQFFLDRIAVPV